MHRPSRGAGPVRFGDASPAPDVGPSRIPADVYTDPARWELERTRVFRNNWFMVARSQTIPSPRDFLVWEEFGETVVVARQESGALSAFHNVCQHRGARIAARSGHIEENLRCPWHGWAYDATGRVAGIPDREDFDPASLEGLCAPAVAVSEWGGWIWLHLAGPAQAPALLDDLAEVAVELAPYRMEEMQLHAEATWEMPVNWKAVVDAFIEVYHVAETHRVTIGDALAVRDTAITLFDKHSMYVVPYTETLEKLRRSQDHQRHANTHYHVFPISIFNCQATHIQAFTPIPTGPHSTRFVAWNLIQPGGDRKFQTEMDRAWSLFTRVAGEDLYVATQAGATRQSMAYTRNLNSARECRITHFLSIIDKQIAG